LEKRLRRHVARRHGLKRALVFGELHFLVRVGVALAGELVQRQSKAAQ
jgi:hypothetical protein